MVGNGRILRSRDLADALRKEHSGSDEIRISEEDRILLDFMSSHNMRIDGPGDWRPIVRDIMHKYGVENDTMMEKRHALAESLRNQIDGETDFEVHDDPIEDDDAAIVLQVPKGRVEPWWFTHSQVPIINIEDSGISCIEVNVAQVNDSNQNGIVYREVRIMSNMPNEEAIAARRRALAEALRNGDDVVVTASGEVEFPEEAQATGETAIQVPNAKLA